MVSLQGPTYLYVKMQNVACCIAGCSPSTTEAQ